MFVWAASSVYAWFEGFWRVLTGFEGFFELSFVFVFVLYRFVSFRFVWLPLSFLVYRFFFFFFFVVVCAGLFYTVISCLACFPISMSGGRRSRSDGHLDVHAFSCVIRVLFVCCSCVVVCFFVRCSCVFMCFSFACRVVWGFVDVCMCVCI